MVNNHLTGEIPSESSNLIGLRCVQVFTASVHPSPYFATFIAMLLLRPDRDMILSNNDFRGTISSAVATLKNLQ